MWDRQRRNKGEVKRWGINKGEKKRDKEEK